MVRDLKFQIKEVEGFYLYRENNGADQLHDLRSCFRICKKQGFFHDAVQKYSKQLKQIFFMSGSNNNL